MNTRQLSYIIAISETGSLSNASRSLGISQPALSKYLAELEEQVGTDLFIRYKKKLYPTPAGQMCIDAAKRVISVKEQTYQTIRFLTGQNNYTGSVTVGATPFRGAMKIAEILPAFNRKYPHTEVIIKEQYPPQLRSLLREGAVNMTLGSCMDVDEPDIDYISANEEDIVLFVPSFHPLAHLASHDLEHLTTIDIGRFADTPFILGGEGSTFYRLAMSIFKQNNMSPTIVYQANNNLILRNMVQAGAGVTLLPRSLIEPSSRIVYFSLRPNYFTHLSIMVRPGRVLSEEEQYIIALIFASELDNPNYRFLPTPRATEIIDRYNLTEIKNELMLE